MINKFDDIVVCNNFAIPSYKRLSQAYSPFFIHHLKNRVMKTSISVLLLLSLSVCVKAQTTTLIHNAKARTNTFLVFGQPYFGIDNQGHKISFSFINHYSIDLRSQYLEAVRMDLTAQTATYKTVPFLSSGYAVWSYCLDSLNNIYVSFNYNRKLGKFNFQDSIYYQDLGNVFQDTSRHALVYSMSLGADNNMYFGSSSGGTFASEYNPYTDSIKRYNLIDDWQDYVLTVQGDSNFIYAQTGQRNVVDFWCIQKRTGYMLKLWSLPSTTRFNIKTGNDHHCYVNFNGLTYRLNGWDTTRIASWNAIKYNNVNGTWMIVLGWNPTLSEYTYKDPLTNVVGSIHINSSWIPNNIRFMFFDKTDPNGFYYCGEYYGGFYYYNLLTDSVTVLGETGANIYSEVQYDDSTFYFGSYPDGVLMRWNKNQPWTLKKYVNGRIVDGYGATDNPHIECYFRTNTPAGFHWPLTMTVKDSFIVAAGTVDRVTPTTNSIAAWNVNSRRATGYDWSKISAVTGARDVITWRQWVIYSTNYGANGQGHPRLYFYNPVTNLMDDSVDANVNLAVFGGGFGKLEIVDDTLIGACGQACYKMYLPTKEVIATYTGIPNYNTENFEHNFLALNTTAALPPNYFMRFLFPNGYAFNGTAYTINGQNIYRVNISYPNPPPQNMIVRNTTLFFYPNPTTGILHISGNGKFYLYDMRGRLLRIRENSGTIDMSGLSAGMYFINGKKVIKE